MTTTLFEHVGGQPFFDTLVAQPEYAELAIVWKLVQKYSQLVVGTMFLLNAIPFMFEPQFEQRIVRKLGKPKKN